MNQSQPLSGFAMLVTRYAAVLLFACSPLLACAGTIVKDTAELVAAIREGGEGATIEIAAGTYKLDATLELKAGMSLKGAGIDKTIITHSATWKPSTQSLPDPEMKLEGLDTDAYLIRIHRDTSNVTISDMTLLGPQLHGGIFAWFHKNLHVDQVQFKDMLWSGIRTFGMQHAKIHDCEFVDAGGRWDNGKPGVNGGNTGGGIFAVWMSDSEVFNNRFVRTQTGPADEYYGIKVRQGTRCHVHHNTIETNFSMEFPFENDEDNEIDHNICRGTISIPKYAGGVVPTSGRTFHIHHNWMKDSYSIEFARNGVEIDHNLFDFALKMDHGNLISGFGDAAAAGPVSFHNNLVSNPGRGVIWINEVYNNIVVRNNHIIARTTATPRDDGLFGLNGGNDFATISIKDNIIQCTGLTRPLLRSQESYTATIENNTLINVSDADKLTNAKADRLIGLEKPLQFQCGVRGEFTVDGWKTRPTKKK